MSRVVISENTMVFPDISLSSKEIGDHANRMLSVNGSVNAQGSSKGSLDEKDFFAMFDEIWSRLLMLAKQLRDIMQFYNQKKQELGWGLEINALQQNVKAIDNSYGAAMAGAIGGITGGVLMCAGAGIGARCGEVWMMAGNAMGQMANSAGTFTSGNETRKADTGKAIAELQNKGSQSYAKTLDDTLMKAREIMQQMMDMGRNLVEVFSQVLRAISR